MPNLSLSSCHYFAVTLYRSVAISQCRYIVISISRYIENTSKIHRKYTKKYLPPSSISPSLISSSTSKNLLKYIKFLGRLMFIGCFLLYSEREENGCTLSNAIGLLSPYFLEQVQLTVVDEFED